VSLSSKVDKKQSGGAKCATAFLFHAFYVGKKPKL
jgi:hypothetical protein